MNHRLKYATFCSGIECMSVAARGLPLDQVFFSEIEPFPCAVLKSNYPTIPNLGDMSKIRRDENGNITNGTTTIPFPDGGIDILAAGCPCQDFSIAGKRAGGEEGSGTRSSLIFEFIRIVNEIRPRYFIYENVPGMLTTNKGRDFAHILMAFRDCGYGCAWRILDAQYVRVDGMERAIPQRRRRVWVVGCLGGDVTKAAQILFEPKGIAGDNPPRRRTGQEIAAASRGRNRIHGGMVGEAPRDRECVSIEGNGSRPSHRGDGVSEEGCLYTLNAVEQHKVAYKRTNGRGEDVAATISADDITQSGQGYVNNSVIECFNKVSHACGKDGEGERWDKGDVASTRNTLGTCNSESPNNDKVVKVAIKRPKLKMIYHESGGNESFEVKGDAMLTLKSTSDANQAHNQLVLENEEPSMQDLILQMKYIVRRLTPTETERLMGLPDGWTTPKNIVITDELVEEFRVIHDTFKRIMAEYENAPMPRPTSAKQVRKWLEKITNPDTCPDAPRYKGCGNGWATNQPRWILTRLLAQEGIDPFED